MAGGLDSSIEQWRADAQRQRKEKKWTDAARTFQKAIAALDRQLLVLRLRGPSNQDDLCKLLETLSQTYGSLAGTWRDAQDYAQAQKYYDKGNDAEKDRREHCGHLDSYNLLQRLVVRILEHPKDWKEVVVDGMSLAEALSHARGVIAKQVEAGRHDSWALADLALVTILCDESAERTLASLDKRHVDRAFYESTHKAVSALIAEGLGSGTELHERLIRFQEFLEQKGGLRAGREA
jgi:tetratricopeptide (TPR) repeat protein